MLVRMLASQYFKGISPDGDINSMRRTWERLSFDTKLSSRGVRVRETSIEGIACEWLVPKYCDHAPVMLYLHGGAYAMGSPATHRRMVSSIARAAKVRALVPDYRLAPEHPFPAALNDVTSVYLSLLQGELEPSEIAIAGDSAGGGLAMAMLLNVRDAGGALPAAACLLSPWLDLALEGESLKNRADKDPFFRPELLPEVVRIYTPDEDTKNPLISPIYGDLKGLPPMLIQVGDEEILLSDSTRLADNLSSAGIPVILQVWPGMWHVFQYFAGRMPESKRAIAQIGQYLRKQLGLGK